MPIRCRVPFLAVGQGVQHHPHHDAERTDQHHSGSVGIGGGDFRDECRVQSGDRQRADGAICPADFSDRLGIGDSVPCPASSITAKNTISTMLKMAETFSTRRPVIVLAKYTTKARV